MATNKTILLAIKGWSLTDSVRSISKADNDLHNSEMHELVSMVRGIKGLRLFLFDTEWCPLHFIVICKLQSKMQYFTLQVSLFSNAQNISDYFVTNLYLKRLSNKTTAFFVNF